MDANVLEMLLQFNNQTNGKDRIFRLLQYSSRLCWWATEKFNLDKGVIGKLKKLEYTLSTGRKLLKLGRSLDTFYATLKTIHLPDLVLRATLTMAKINHALYLVMDHIIWLNRVELIKLNNEKWNNRANKFWLFSLVMHLSRDIYEILRMIKLEQECNQKYRHSQPGDLVNMRANRDNSLRSKDAKMLDFILPLLAMSVEQKGVALDTVKNACDLFIPMSGLHVVNISPGFIGLCGVLSSLISIFVIFNPKFAMKPR